MTLAKSEPDGITVFNREIHDHKKQPMFFGKPLGVQRYDGYIKIISVMQKFFDQAISGNWSYNPEHYPDNEVPVSVMANDLLTTYKYGWKTSYYQNTNDLKTDEVDVKESLDKLLGDCSIEQEEDCESCKI